MKKGTASILSGTIGMVLGAMAGVLSISKMNTKEVGKWQQLADKHLALMRLLDQWLATKQEGKSIIEYFHTNKIKSIAIYGMSYVGERLFNELKNSDIEVKYAIDKNAEEIYAEVDVLSPDETLPEIDAIVVTPIFFFDEIEEILAKKTAASVLSLEDILYKL